jgi:hypothetical protein
MEKYRKEIWEKNGSNPKKIMKNLPMKMKKMHTEMVRRTIP